MANPRKFSEKIALHNQKQAEETAAFEAILREVSATTRQAATVKLQQPQQPQHPPQQHLHLSQPNLSLTCRGRSLPNVNQMTNSSGIDLQSALSSLEDMKQAVSSGQTISAQTHRDRSPQSHKKQFLLDRHRDCSPYGSVYLCPPSDANWRRASSDSAIHSSVMATSSQNLSGASSMLLSNGQIENGTLLVSGGIVGMDFGQSLDSKTMSMVLRPRSCDVPGINIFPSPEPSGVTPGVVHLPIPCSTGSLPNLTDLNFSLPLTMPIDIDSACCGPGEESSANYSVAGPQTASMNTGAVPQRLNRPVVPVPLVLLGGSGGEDDKFLPSNGTNGLHSAQWGKSQLDSTQSPPMIVITDVNQNGETLGRFGKGVRDSDYELSRWHSNVPSRTSPCRCSPSQHNQFVRNSEHQTVKVDVNNSRHHAETLAQYGTVVSAHSPVSPLSASSLHSNSGISSFISPADPFVSAQVLYAVTHRSSQDNTFSSGDLSPRAPAQLSPAAASPQWFAHSPTPSSPSRQVNTSTSGELSPAHASALQQRFQQFNMVPDEQSMSARGASTSVGLYSFTAQPMSVQQPLNISQPMTPPVLASAGLVFVPAAPLTTNQCATPMLWQVSQPFPQTVVATSQALTTGPDNPGFFRVAAGSLPVFETCHPTVFGSGIAGATMQTPVSGTGITPDIIAHHTLHSQAETVCTEQSVMRASSSIPDIVLTAEDLPVYSNQPLPVCVGASDCLTQADPGINPLSYLGDSFDASTDLFTAEDALKLGLDPLEIEELQMLADASIVTDPATEDSFRLDRQC